MKFTTETGTTYLVIDQGNTLTKVALFDGDDIKWVSNFNTLSASNVDDLKLDQYNIKAGIVCSVSAEASSLLPVLPKVPWFLLDHTTPVPVKNCYQTPETLGKDRLAAVVAASNMFEGNDVLVIDAGTAITYDFINREKEYLGGSISPGLTIRFKALHTFTGRLPLYGPEHFDTLTGANTRESILSGVMNGTKIEIDGIIQQYQAKYPGLKTILTGGDAIYFDKMLKSDIFASSNLVIKGLKLILQHNFEK